MDEHLKKIRRGETAGRMLTAKERRVAAFEMRKCGMPYSRIGLYLGISPQAAHKAITVTLRELASKLDESLDDVRQMELERLDNLLFAHWSKAESGDGPATDRVIKIMERRAKIMGLDSPAELLLSTDEVREYRAFKEYIKYDERMQSTFNQFLGRLSGEDKTDIIDITERLINILSEESEGAEQLCLPTKQST